MARAGREVSSESRAQKDSSGINSNRAQGKLSPREDGAWEEPLLRVLRVQGSEPAPHCSGITRQPSAQGRRNGRRSPMH